MKDVANVENFEAKEFFEGYFVENKGGLEIFVKKILEGQSFKNAIANTLYEVLDVPSEKKSEGFAEYCLQTASEVLCGLYDNIDDVQDNVMEILANEVANEETEEEN